MLAIALACAAAGCAPIEPPAAVAVSACRATDGDTIRCGDERIRLLGIDAPELPGHCRQGRRCAPGDPVAAREGLARALAGGAVMLRRVGRDRYGRTLGLVEVCAASSSGAVGGNCRDQSCAQLERGAAVYVRRWDDGRLVARACPALAR